MPHKETPKALVGFFFLGLVLMAPLAGIFYVGIVYHRDIDGGLIFVLGPLAMAGGGISLGCLTSLIKRDYRTGAA